MKKQIPATLFLMMTAGLIYSGSQSVATNTNFGNIAAPLAQSGLDVSCSAIAADTGANKSISVYQSGSTAGLPSDRFVIAATTVSCNTRPNNVGATISGTYYEYPVPEWYAAWDGDLPSNDARGARHPYIATNVYRTNAAGRIEQLSNAWVKHGWYAASTGQSNIGGANGSPACGTAGCSGPSNNGLGANCSDTYGAGLNVAADDVGPRSEITPNAPAGTPSDPGNIGWQQTGSWHNLRNRDSANTYRDIVTNTTGALSRAYSYTGTTQSWKLNAVKIDDIKPAALGTNGRLFIEGYYVVNGDRYKFNNVAYRRFSVTGITASTAASAVTTANFSLDGPHNFGPAMLDWGDKQAAFAPANEGTVYVSSRVVAVGGGVYRYEYALYNLDLDREVNMFEVPMPTFANRTADGFAQPRAAEPGYHSHVDPFNPPSNFNTPDNNTDWINTYDGAKSAAVYTPPTPPVGYIANTLRWGKMNTYWFNSSLPPRLGSVTVGQRRSGVNGPLAAAGIPIPKHPCDIANDDGTPCATFTVTAGTFRSGSGAVNEGDYNCFFQNFFDPVGPIPVCDIADDTGVPGANGNVNEGDYNCFFLYFFND